VRASANKASAKSALIRPSGTFSRKREKGVVPPANEELCMDPDYWHQRWQQNQTGFHQDQVTPLLQKHWPALDLPPASRIFVPLCGKTLDMVWFAAQGHRVLGVELSRLAIEQFFAEHRLTPETHDSPLGRHYRAGTIEIIHGDAFALDQQTLADCNAVHDRAALIALPSDMRRRYVHELYARLPTGCRGLLITLEYPPHEKQGPPFTVPEPEVRELYGRDWSIEVLERRAILDKQPAFAEEGVTALDTVVYRLTRH
jgi:thiopurine S-methyltransferase